MTGMVDSVLKAGREQSAPWVFSPAPVVLGDVWRRLILEVRLDPLAQGRQIQVEGGDLGVGCALDENLLRHIVVNLLSNALKYSAADQPVSVRWSWLQGELTTTVQDRGIGIPEADRQHLFQTYRRGSNVGPVVGVGLGLTVVQQAVACHAGRLEWDSQAGQGTRFTVVLPAPAIAPPPLS
jgi:signal transduction histidine kinase